MEVKRSKVTKNYFHDSFGQITVFKNEPEKVRKIEKKLTVEFKCTAQT